MLRGSVISWSLLLCVASSLAAQATTATLQGAVTTSDGSVLPEAETSCRSADVFNLVSWANHSEYQSKQTCSTSQSPSATTCAGRHSWASDISSESGGIQHRV